MEILIKLLNSLIFGGMTLFSFGFALSLLKQMPLKEARKIIRGTFPMYYSFLLVASLITGIVSFFFNIQICLIMVGTFVLTLFARNVIMPNINRATDTENQTQFKRLHSLSVFIQLLQIFAVGYGVVVL